MNEAVAVARATVLLVEDETLQRLMLADIIEDAGCAVVEATTAAQALRILEARTDILAVVADIDMRGSSAGIALVTTIRDRWPPVELILVGSTRPDEASIPVRGVFHDKPFQQGRIAASIRRFAGMA